MASTAGVVCIVGLKHDSVRGVFLSSSRGSYIRLYGGCDVGNVFSSCRIGQTRVVILFVGDSVAHGELECIPCSGDGAGTVRY